MQEWAHLVVDGEPDLYLAFAGFDAHMLHVADVYAVHPDRRSDLDALAVAEVRAEGGPAREQPHAFVKVHDGHKNAGDREENHDPDLELRPGPVGAPHHAGVPRMVSVSGWAIRMPPSLHGKQPGSVSTSSGLRNVRIRGSSEVWSRSTEPSKIFYPR